jgi:hypothetical protein
VAHSIIGEPAEAADQDSDRDTFQGVEVDSGTAGDRVGIGFENDLAC